MKILQIYNKWRGTGGGESAIVNANERLLKNAGHEILTIREDSDQINSAKAKAFAFVTGIYSISAKTKVEQIVWDYKPDLVHVHNLYPLYSPSVLVACNEQHVPVVMTVHNHGLTCPTTLQFQNSQICKLCASGNAFPAVKTNCTGSMLQSVGYAVRFTFANKARLFHDNITKFAAVSEFIAKEIIDAGYPAEKIVVVPNGVRVPTRMAANGEYVSFVGRVRPEKGIFTFIAAARSLPDIPFKVAGKVDDDMKSIVSDAPANVTFVGELAGEALERFYCSARVATVPSIWNEPFGLTAIEAMSYGVPVVAAKAGALPEIVQDGLAGLLFEPDDAVGLAESISALWSNLTLCHSLGQKGRSTVINSYSESKYFDRMMEVYNRVLVGVTKKVPFGKVISASSSS